MRFIQSLSVIYLLIVAILCVTKPIEASFLERQKAHMYAKAKKKFCGKMCESKMIGCHTACEYTSPSLLRTMKFVYGCKNMCQKAKGFSGVCEVVCNNS